MNVRRGFFVLIILTLLITGCGEQERQKERASTNYCLTHSSSVQIELNGNDFMVANHLELYDSLTKSVAVGYVVLGSITGEIDSVAIKDDNNKYTLRPFAAMLICDLAWAEAMSRVRSGNIPTNKIKVEYGSEEVFHLQIKELNMIMK